MTLLLLALLFGLLGGLLEWSSRRVPRRGDSLVDQIEALLPHIQCAQCGYPGCRPYAVAIAEGTADINQCPPGGTQTLEALARLLDAGDLAGQPVRAGMNPEARAVIDESRCIGCALCLPACPVDAILGAARYMHTVIAAECTGCELCLAPCPVDCIVMQVPEPADIPSSFAHSILP